MIFSRFDLVLTVLMAFTLMAAIAFSSVPGQWTGLHITAVSILVLLLTVLAQRPRVVFGCAFAIVTIRFVIALFLGSHFLFFVTASILCGSLSWLLLRHVERNMDF
jgi:hypothetical protein